MTFQPIYYLPLNVIDEHPEMHEGLIKTSDDIRVLSHVFKTYVPDLSDDNFWSLLSENPSLTAMHMIKQYLERNPHSDKVDWQALSMNPSAIPLLEMNRRIQWSELSSNPNAIHLLEQKQYLINWDYLSRNPNPKAIHLLEQNFDKIYWIHMSCNLGAIHVLEQNMDRIQWLWLSKNPNAIHLLEQNLDKVDWFQLSSNPEAVRLLEQNPTKVRKTSLMKNPNAKHLIKEVLRENRLDIKMTRRLYSWLGHNPKVDEILGRLDLCKMRSQCEPFAKELMGFVLHPSRLIRLCEKYGLELEEYLEMLGD